MDNPLKELFGFGKFTKIELKEFRDLPESKYW